MIILPWDKETIFNVHKKYWDISDLQYTDLDLHELKKQCDIYFKSKSIPKWDETLKSNINVNFKKAILDINFKMKLEQALK